MQAEPEIFSNGTDYLMGRKGHFPTLSKRFFFLLSLVIAAHIWLLKSLSPTFHQKINVPLAKISSINVNLVAQQSQSLEDNNLNQESEQPKEVAQAITPANPAPIAKVNLAPESRGKQAALAAIPTQPDPALGLSTAILDCLDILSFETEAQPCKKTIPYLPKDALSDGFCRALGDVTEFGRLENIRVIKCTDPIYMEPTRSALQEWIYIPAVKNGIRVKELNREIRANYIIEYIDGNDIHDPKYDKPIDLKFKKLTVDDLFKP